MTGKRDYAGGPAVPYYPNKPDLETAKYLRLVAGRYVNGRASRAELDEAIKMFQETK